MTYYNKSYLPVLVYIGSSLLKRFLDDRQTDSKPRGESIDRPLGLQQAPVWCRVSSSSPPIESPSTSKMLVARSPDLIKIFIHYQQ